MPVNGVRLAVVAVAVSTVGLFATSARAMEGNPFQPTQPDPTSFGIVYEKPGGYSTGRSGGAVDCTYTLQTISTDSGGGTAQNSIIENQGVEEVGAGGVAYREDPDGGGRMTLYFRSGPDCATTGLVWVSDSLTPESLIPALRVEITRILPLPVPNMSPAPDVGSYVNLGLWIAIEDPGPQGIRISDGPVWAEADGTLTGFTFDPGDDGEPFDCELTGVPYEEGSQTFDEGPCGHTYTQTSPDGAPFPMTITANYTVDYVLSNGVSDSLGVIPRDDAFPYEVDEIQTIGTGR